MLISGLKSAAILLIIPLKISSTIILPITSKAAFILVSGEARFKDLDTGTAKDTTSILINMSIKGNLFWTKNKAMG